MSADVVELDSRRAHVVVHNRRTGNAHVFPVAYFIDFADGKKVKRPPRGVLQQIVTDWLLCQLEHGGVPGDDDGKRAS